MRRDSRTKLDMIAFEDRLVPAAMATFLINELTVVGDDGGNNNIVVSADANGNLVVTDNARNVAINTASGQATRANTTFIAVIAGDGNDTIVLDKSLNTRDANGKLQFAPNAFLKAGAGNDVLNPQIGGFKNGVIDPNNVVGNTVMNGGTGNDTLISGFGDDIMTGGSGNNTLVWLPGTLNDVFNGGTGHSSAVIFGNANNTTQGDNFVLSKSPTQAGHALFQRTNLVPFFIDITNCEQVDIKEQSGNGSITINDLTGTGIKTVAADGGPGNTIIDGSKTKANVSLILLGGDGNDTLIAGAGKDVLHAGNGNDLLVGGSGKDTLIAGNGNDTLIAGTGTDLLIAGNGNDILKASKRHHGQDTLIAGTGKDTFYAFEKDLVVGFDPNNGDQIFLS